MKNIIEQDIKKREEDLVNKWASINKMVTVNESQFAFEKENNFKNFINNQFKTDQELKSYNFYRNEWFRRAKEFDPGNAPLSVTIELVSTCNLGCSMCYTITEEFENSVVGSVRMLPWPIVKSVIDECADIGVYSILFSWRGESTLYKQKLQNGKYIDFCDVLKYANSKKILEISSLTHGQGLDENFINKLIDAQPNWISFSIDGLFEDYNKIRTPKNKKGNNQYNAFEEVIKSIKLINKIKKEKKSLRPQIRTNTIFPAISKYPYKYRDFMYENGVDWITVNEILDFRSENIDESEIKKNWACQYPFQRLTVAANGTILPCTGAHNEEHDLNLGQYINSPEKKIKINDEYITIKNNQTTLLGAWNSKKINNIRKLHMENKRCELKNGCRNCRHGMKKMGATYVPEDWDGENMIWKNHDFGHG
jgi:MoaA/NifB/PqqE/SkfB family radical SAM enzyme